MNIEELVQAVRRGSRKFILIVWVLTVLFILEEYFRQPNGEGMLHEKNIWTYGSALQFSLAGFLALLAGGLTRYLDSIYVYIRPRVLYLFCAGMFLQFMGADEMLILHEKVSTRLGDFSFIKSMTPNGHVDDILILLYGITGIAGGLLAVRDIKADRRAMKFYAAAAGFAVFAVLCDFLPPTYLSGYLPRASEEILETLFGAAVTSAFTCHVSLAVEKILRASDQRDEAVSQHPTHLQNISPGESAA